jgi:hypothetical protein
MTSPPLERPRLGIVAVSVLTALWLGLSTLLDHEALLELISPLFVAGFGLATIGLVGVALRAPRHALIGCAILGAWLAVLPFVRSSALKGFYMDCHSVRPGMSLPEVGKVMSPYLLLGCPPEKEPALSGLRRVPWFSSGPDAEPDRITFISSVEDPADWCIVYTKDGTVSAVDVSPD